MNVDNQYYYGTGRRKNSVARVFLRKGTGEVFVNSFVLSKYFIRDVVQIFIKKPLVVVNMINELDLFITVKGGGKSGQASAIQHGIARALLEYDITFKTLLRQSGFITRDSRCVERKKCGFRKSRRRPQFSKR